MIKSYLMSHTMLNVTFSLLVKAKRKSHALGMADFQINDKNIILDRIQLVNEQGSAKLLKVEHIDPIHWSSVESTEYSHLFKVVGQIRFVLSTDRISERSNLEHSDDPLWASAYRLPRSLKQDRTILVIPTTNEPAFTQVINQSLEIVAEPGDSTLLVHAG